MKIQNELRDGMNKRQEQKTAQTINLAVVACKET